MEAKFELTGNDKELEFRVHYAKAYNGGSMEDIPCIIFHSPEEVGSFMLSKTTEKKVYLVSIIDEVFVTEHIYNAVLFLETLYLLAEHQNMIDFCSGDNLKGGYDIFLQEYHSFEEAYKVSWNMMEISELCYDNDDYAKLN